MVPAVTGIFDRATAVSRRTTPNEVGTDHVDHVVFDAEVHDGWDIGGNANGGYLLAIAGRAMADVTGRPPLTITAHYLAPAPAGPCTVEVTPVRSGRRMATATASLHQGGRAILQVLGTFAEQVSDGRSLIDGGPPDLPDYALCEVPPPPVSPAQGPMPQLNERLAVRMRPGDSGFRTGHKTGRPEMVGWFAFADERPIDAIALLLVADAFAPPIFNTEVPVAWVPTLELTVHVRAEPAPGPLRCAFRSRFIVGGLVEEDGEVWDAAGALVCQSRQLSLTPRE
jgi:acyl-coenzyme A thioesterase PaaI-like protein